MHSVRYLQEVADDIFQVRAKDDELKMMCPLHAHLYILMASNLSLFCLQPEAERYLIKNVFHNVHFYLMLDCDYNQRPKYIVCVGNILIVHSYCYSIHSLIFNSDPTTACWWMRCSNWLEAVLFLYEHLTQELVKDSFSNIFSNINLLLIRLFS